MGKTKKFLSKENSTKYLLLHRSQQDSEYGKDGASALVLFPADQQGRGQKSSEGIENVLKRGRDHVNSLGNDST